MNNINLNLDELLRFFFAGVWGLIWLQIINPKTLTENLNLSWLNDSFVLILIALVFGVLIYTFHRAALYPLLYKITFIVLFFFRKIRWDWFLLLPYYPSSTEKANDFRRWKERQKEKSISKNLITWGSQIHFLYCSAWAILLVILISKQFPNEGWQNLGLARNTFWILIVISFIHHVRYMLYDIETENND